ncbi:MAG TPA: hypothetical protein VFB04_07440 [Terriglobales bacterium]|nr:hypothetical protein [Terriglobales bacterium]
MSQPTVELRASDLAVPPDTPRWQSRALMVGIAGIIFCVIGGVLNLRDFLRGYLVAYMFWTGLSLGCMALLMVQYLSGGFWGLCIRRILEAGAKNLALMFVLFLPILILRHDLYRWMNDPSLTHENYWYLTQGKWIFRWIFYFLIWGLLTYELCRRGNRQDAPIPAATYPRFQGLSGAGLVLYSLTASFAAVDWIMSLDPNWGSTMYGLIFLVGQGLSALCFSIIMLTVLTRYRPFDRIIKPMQFHDIGKLTLAFVMLFAYFSFSQWLIIWSGNLPDEISWYLQRIRGAFGWIIIGIILLHFALPFALLLSRDRKRAGRRLIPIAILLMVMRLVDIYWYTIPNFRDARLFSIWYLAAPIGLGGLWLYAFFFNFRKRPLLPLYETQMPNFLHQGAGHGH